MGIRYIVIKKDGRGGSQSQVTELKGDTVIIGRGGNSQILLESHLVSLEHAAVSLQSESLQISDLGSSSGILVNTKKVPSAALERGDIVQLGDIIFDIDKDTNGWVLIQTLGEAGPSSADRLKRIVKNIEYSYNLPSGRVLSILVVALVFIFGFVLPVDDNNFHLWTTGPISTYHGMLQNKCSECHGRPFAAISDERCSACHLMTEHVPLTTKLTGLGGEVLSQNCADCHREHSDSHSITLSDDKLCVSCHSGIKSHAVDTKVQNVKNFNTHPQFSIDRVTSGRPPQRVSLDDAENLWDSSRIKLNHKIHLAKNLRGENGPVTLSCANCHQLNKDASTMQPVTFDRNCRGCHTLGFDERIAKRQVPHAQPDVVYNFLYAEYAKLALADRQNESPPRQLPGRAVRGDEDAVGLAKQEIIKEARKSESEIFERTGCTLCHEIRRKTEKPSEVNSILAAQSSLFEVLSPNVPKMWFSAARFKHSAHLEVRCESCHRGVSESTKTSDVLLPKIETCRSCHGDTGAADKVNSNCTMCHSYHDSLPLKNYSKRRIEEILYNEKSVKRN